MWDWIIFHCLESLNQNSVQTKAEQLSSILSHKENSKQQQKQTKAKTQTKRNNPPKKPNKTNASLKKMYIFYKIGNICYYFPQEKKSQINLHFNFFNHVSSKPLFHLWNRPGLLFNFIDAPESTYNWRMFPHLPYLKACPRNKMLDRFV